MRKKLISIFYFLLYFSFLLSAQIKKIDYYSIGYNDGYNDKKFDNKFSIENISDSLNNISDEDDQIEFIHNVEAYNLGFIHGACEKQDLDYEDYDEFMYEYFFSLMTKNSSSEVYNPIISAEEYHENREMYDWYKTIGVIQTTTTDGATVRVNIFFGYKKDDTATVNDIKKRTVEIKDYIRRYFKGKTKTELENSENENRFKMEIRNGINELILVDGRLRDISFDQLNIMD